MIYLPKIYQVILFKGKYKRIFLNSLVSFCLLRLFNLSIHHTLYRSSLLQQKLYSGLKNSELA